jgi:hypothetical protein
VVHQRIPRLLGGPGVIYVGGTLNETSTTLNN